MIFLKNEEEIALIKQGAMILSKVQGLIAQTIAPGITTQVLDQLAETFIKDYQAVPSFKGYQGFPATLCTSVNEQVVHGIPSKYSLQEGDILSVDCGVCYRGFHSDMAFTYPIGNVSSSLMELLITTKKALLVGIQEAVVGKSIGDIGYRIQKYVQKKGYSVVRELTGHGIGKNLHEGPAIFNYGKKKTTKIQPGMVLAIEPIVNIGKHDVVQRGWHISTSDKKPSAHFEHTVAVLAHETSVLTSYQYIETVFKF